MAVYQGFETGQPTMHRITLDLPVPEIHAGELARRIFFISETITDFTLVRSGDQISAVDVAVEDEADLDGLTRKLRFVVANDVVAQRPFDPKVIWSRETGVASRDVFGELTERGIATEPGQGLVAFGEPVLSLMDYLDARVRALVIAEFGAKEYRYPTIMPVSVLNRCGYLKSFPQLMMFVSRLHSDVDVYRRFLSDLDDGQDLTKRLCADAADVEYCLPPTMCFHTYAQLAGRALPTASAVFTSRGKSFRFESRYQRSLERLWDFTIREIVFVGPRDFVVRSRARLMELTFALAAELGLSGYCGVANDPFFVSTDTAERVWSQQLLELKYELRVPLEADRDVAVCSFNFHDRFFGQAFGIESAAVDGAAYTACAGYGLERFAYAFLCQHGLDPSGWPAEVRKAVIP